MGLDWTSLLDDVYVYAKGLRSDTINPSICQFVPIKIPTHGRAAAQQLTLTDFGRLPTDLQQIVLRSPDGIQRMTTYALEQFCDRLKVPDYYIHRCPPQLQCDNLNTWLREINRAWVLRCRSDVIRGVVSPQYIPYSHSRVLHAVVTGLGLTTVTPRYHYVDDELLYIVLGLDDYARPLGWTLDGSPDLHTPSIYITNSEVGSYSVSVKLGIWRQVCGNGLMIFEHHQVRRKHQHMNPEELDEEIRIMVTAALAAAPQSMNRIQLAKDTRIDQPEKAIHDIAQEEKLPIRARDAVLAGWRAEPTPTLFGLVQAFTSGAKRLEPASRLRLEQLAGKILEGGWPRVVGGERQAS